MTGLEAALQDYLALRRSMGFKLRRAEKLLGSSTTAVPSAPTS